MSSADKWVTGYNHLLSERVSKILSNKFPNRSWDFIVELIHR